MAEAIVYTSKTGYTKQYADMLGAELSLPVCSVKEARARLSKGDTVIYLGWICASRIKGYAGVARRFKVCIVCGVGLCDTGTMLDEVRRATAVPTDIPLFTLQGGFDRSRLHGVSKLVIAVLTKGLSDRKTRSATDERMLELLTSDAVYVSRDKLQGVIDRYRSL